MAPSVGPYELEEALGEGALGVTHRARDTRTGGIVALKLIRPHLVRDSDALGHLQHEARIAGQLDHPNIARMVEQGVDGDACYVAAEYAPGETLRARLLRGRLSEAEAHGIAMCVAHALNAASVVRVTHRNLTPENILLGEDGQLRVCDFNLTRAFDAATPTHTIAFVPAPAYAAPELAERRGDIRSDLYSLGVIMFESLTGRLPCIRESGDAAQKKNASQSPDAMLLRQLAPSLDRIVLRLLEKDAGNRPGEPEQLIQALQSVVRMATTPIGETVARVASQATEPATAKEAPPAAEVAAPVAAPANDALPTLPPTAAVDDNTAAAATLAAPPEAAAPAKSGRRFSLFGSKPEKKLNEYAERVLVDDVLSEADEKSFMEFAASLGITSLDEHPALRDRLTIARANDGRLPVLTAPPHFYGEPGEIVHFEAKAALLEDIVVTAARGLGVDFLPARGARYRTGDVQPVSGHSVAAADSGTLSVTSHRIVFTGAKGTHESLYSKLEFLRVYRDGIGVAVSNRQNRVTYGLYGASGEVVAAVINASVQQLTGAQLRAD